MVERRILFLRGLLQAILKVVEQVVATLEMAVAMAVMLRVDVVLAAAVLVVTPVMVEMAEHIPEVVE